MRTLLLSLFLCFSFLLTTPAPAGEGSLTVTVPDSVERALDDVGIHIERKDDRLKQAAIIGGGVVVAGIIVALALRRRRV